MPSSSIEEVLSRYRSYAPGYKPGEKAPISGTYICDRGTMLPPVRVQLTKGDAFPEVERLGTHTRWRETNIQGKCVLNALGKRKLATSGRMSFSTSFRQSFYGLRFQGSYLPQRSVPASSSFTSRSEG